jgi:hypothetical protein
MKAYRITGRRMEKDYDQPGPRQKEVDAVADFMSAFALGCALAGLVLAVILWRC